VVCYHTEAQEISKQWRQESLGILSSIIVQSLKAKPFQSEPLDRLADVMQTTGILKRGKLQRYYKVRSLQAGCLSYSDVVFFDAKYYDTLLPEELLAVGAHEFYHIIGRHGMKRFVRIFIPAAAIAALIGLLAFVNYELINSIPFFSSSGKILSSLFFALLSFLFLLSAFFYVNAKWNRQQESKSDINAVKFTNGEALISALVKLNKLRPKKVNRLESRLLPNTYPTLEQRINDIRAAMERGGAIQFSNS